MRMLRAPDGGALMPVTVSVNGRTVIHRGSEGMALGSPDVCKTPKSGSPVPYVNLAVSADLENGAVTVFVDGHRVAKASSYLARSTGDEPGTEGGIISGCNLCTCHALRMKMGCFKLTLASPGRAPTLWGGLDTTVWDSRFFPGLYIEPSFGPVGPKGKPTGEWDVIPSKAKSRWKDAKGKPLPLPAGEWVPGSRRPDVVVARDPQKPLTKQNIKEVIEVKFPPDRFDKDQQTAYEKLLPPGATVREANPKTCKCPSVFREDVLQQRRPYQYKLPKEWLPKRVDKEICRPEKKEVEPQEKKEVEPPEVVPGQPPPFDVEEFLKELPPLVPIPVPILQRIPVILRGPPIIILMPPGGLLPPEPPIA
jgi:hypothetical protein